MRKFEQFFIKIANLRSTVRNHYNSDLVKVLAGNSPNNKRTPSVAQTIRFLKYKKNYKLANQLQNVLEIMRGHIKESRQNRTDAIDLNELVSVYRTVVMNRRDPFMRRRIGFYLNKSR